MKRTKRKIRIKDAHKAEKLKNVIRNKEADLQVDVKTRRGRRRGTVHIKDIETETTDRKSSILYPRLLGSNVSLKSHQFGRLAEKGKLP